MILRTILVALLIILMGGALRAQEPENLSERFQEANRLYSGGNYNEALSVYLELEKSGFRSGELYYNCANTYYKLSQLGKAILYYERSMKFMPQDEDLRTNLQLARLSIADKITPIPELFYQRYWRSIKYMTTFTRWKTFAFIFYLMLGVWIAVRLFSRNEIIRRLSKSIIAVLFVCSFLSFWVTVSISRDRENAGTGVILAGEVHVRSSPAEEGTELFSLHEGTKVWIKRASEGWCEIRIADGKTGWLPQESYEVI